MTVIGSSNFGYRSNHRDVEAQALIFTENKELQLALGKEAHQLWTRSCIVDIPTLKARKVHWLTKIVAHVTRNMF
jgi:CDP-diacylglycerol--glycerol-3-phosphate 3-phosphatidyltransferase